MFAGKIEIINTNATKSSNSHALTQASSSKALNQMLRQILNNRGTVGTLEVMLRTFVETFPS